MSRIEHALPVVLILAAAVTVAGVVVAVFNSSVGSALIGSGTVFASVGSVLAVSGRQDRLVEPSQTIPENATEAASRSAANPEQDAGQRLVTDRSTRNGHDLVQKALSAFTRLAMWVSLLGAAIALAAFGFGVYEHMVLVRTNTHLAAVNTSLVAAKAQLTDVNRQLRLAKATDGAAIKQLQEIAKQSRILHRDLLPLPTDGALIVASVVGPNTHTPEETRNKPIQCYQPPNGYSFVSVQEDNYPGTGAPEAVDTHGGPPACNEDPPKNCMDGNVRCWNIRLQSGCLVNSEWLSSYNAWLKKNGLPQILAGAKAGNAGPEAKHVCQPNARFPEFEREKPSQHAGLHIELRGRS